MNFSRSETSKPHSTSKRIDKIKNALHWTPHAQPEQEHFHVPHDYLTALDKSLVTQTAPISATVSHGDDSPAQMGASRTAAKGGPTVDALRHLACTPC
jgi:hypothetical protein